DMRMPPGWDGLETTERVWDLDPNLQIVICTAYSDYSWNEITTRLQSHGENLLILKKPFDQAEVAQLALSLTRKWWLTHQANMKLEELEQMVANQTNKIAEARSMAERTEKAKSDFVQGMCLKIHPNLESILEFCDEISGESVRKIRMEHLQRIRTTSKNLLTVIEDLLAVSRMDVTEETE
ncbi:MAG: hypothetical protein MI892_14190, partial [Desulfobacterales bacterium]|nr:hypothetical protein [Desulfobacterales bacterium]